MSFWQTLFKTQGHSSRTEGMTHASAIAQEESDNRATHVALQGLIHLRFHSSRIALDSQRKAYSALAGQYMSPFKGRGLNFDEVRPYQPGDDIRNIDWNVTARTDRVHTKVFKEERERPVFIVVDLSRSMYFGTRHCLKSVTAAKAAALFAWAGADYHNRIGGVVFNDSDHREMRPRGGHQGVLRYLKMLTDFHNAPLENTLSNAESFASDQRSGDNNHNSNFSTEFLFARLQKLIHPGSIVLFASDFTNTTETALKHIRHIARHNDLLMAHIYDPIEAELPPAGRYAITDGEDFQQIDTSDSSLRQAFQRSFHHKEQEIEQFCIHNQSNLIKLATCDKVPERFIATLGRDTTTRRIARSRH